ncbi:MAG TPA: hypothetical protein PLD27_12855 [bacterium]|nr:hypothetical protein [bacterium]HOL48820.1 hypothetical protein [bacterium]
MTKSKESWNAKFQTIFLKTYCFFKDIINNKDIYLIFTFLNDIKHLNRLVNQIQRLENAKVAIIYYDYLFRKDVSLALSLCGIKTVAAQERGLITSTILSFYNFDYYYIWGQAFENIIKKYTLSNVSNYIISGYIKSDFTINTDKNYLKYQTLQEKYFVILALDFHSEIGSPLNKFNKQFYNLLIKIAEKFSNAYIIIKGKNARFLELDEFADITKKINELPNLAVETLLKKYKSDIILKNVDLVLACITSLAEQAIALGIKTIFYNPPELNYPPKEIDEYAKYEIVANNDEQTIAMIDKIINRKEYIADIKFAELRNNYFFRQNNGKIEITIKNHIKKLVLENKEV